MTQDLRYGTPAARWVLLATVLGSGMAFLDSTVVNVALPAIAEEFSVSLSSLQWTLDSYLLTLSALILLGGSLGDLYGRRLVFFWGLVLFTVASALCGLAPSIEALIAARALQGVGAALMVPGSLAIISTTFRPQDRGQAIGAWSGLSGVTTALGPPLGGYLVDAGSWRLVFFINLPIAAAAIFVTLRHVPETRAEGAGHRPDIAGAATAMLGLGALIYSLIEGPVRGFSSLPVLAGALAGISFCAAFLIIEARRENPMLPLEIFSSRQFSGANGTTLVVYAALSGALFLVVLQLQSVLGYSALEAGSALVPITLLLLVLSARAGKLATTIGPRLPMTLGPLIAGGGLALMSRIVAGSSYLSTVLPGVVVFGLGLSLTVAPLTAAALAAVEDRHAGIGSGVNNAVARVAGLLAVALLPLAAGIAGGSAIGEQRFSDGFSRAMLIAAALCVVGALNSWLTIRSVPLENRPSSADPSPGVPAG
ncbi:MFS transporter [soil metagenome]